jgi:hypothetical protein
MKSQIVKPTRSRRRAASSGAALSAAALVAVGGLFIVSSGVVQAATSVGLGTADSFAVLAGSGITNTGPTTITGDIGTFPTTTISGESDITLTGTNHGGDAVTQEAKDDLVTAYNDAAGQGPVTTISADLGGSTLVAGVYNSADSLGLTGTLTLDAEGDADAVFIFQAGSTLTTAVDSSIELINGAQSCNVFWQVGSSATLGTDSTFRGSILALTSISLTTGATVDGRLLARDGAVTLDTNTITRAVCATVDVPVEPTPTPTPAPVEPAPVEPAPVEPAPAPVVTPTPVPVVTPAPAPVEPAPVAVVTPTPEPGGEQVAAKPLGGVETGIRSS